MENGDDAFCSGLVPRALVRRVHGIAHGNTRKSATEEINHLTERKSHEARSAISKPVTLPKELQARP